MERFRSFIIEKKTQLCIIAFFIVMLTISIIARIPDENIVYLDCDASYHTLLTIKAYDETPISVHKFAPLLSLGDESDKYIPWGKTIESNGNYYYTSFSAASFFIAYVFFKLFSLPLTIKGLYVLNCVIYVICTSLSSLLAVKLFKDKFPSWFIVIISFLIFGFQTEILHSFGAIYWAQSIFQIVFVVQMLLFLSFDNKKCRIAFYILCVFAPYLEWSGFITNVGFAVAFLIKGGIIRDKKFEPKALKIPAIIAALTVTAGILFILHFSLVLPFKTVIELLKDRFFVRSASHAYATYSVLFAMYWRSYGLLLPLIGISLIAALVVTPARKRLVEILKEYKLILIISAFAVPENLILKEHAIVYTYDRMKVLFFLFFVLMICLIALRPYLEKWQIPVCVLFLALSCFNLYMYSHGDKFNDGFYKKDIDFAADNEYVAECIKQLDKNDVLLAQTLSTRGYTNLLFDRGVYEECNEEDTLYLAYTKGKKYAVLLMPEDGVLGIYKYSRLKVYDAQTFSSISFKLENHQLVETEEF